jgi:uncharacterized protein (DUF1499 family)
MKKMYWILGAVAIGLIVAVGAVIFGLARASSQTPHRSELKLGVTDGQLTECPDSPNCVSTHASPEDETHYAEPISYSGERAAVRERVLSHLREKPRTDIITNDEDYIHAEVRSRIFRFVDDLELYFPDEQKVVHLRSASRVGEGDMGVNRKRYEEMKAVIRRE